MERSFAFLLVLAVAACRNYDLHSRVTDQGGLMPPDRYARYGHEQAEAMAIAREFGHAGEGPSAEALKQQAEAAVGYAKTLPDVADVHADPQGYLLTIRFKSGWRTMVTPIENGKRGAETVGLPAKAGSSASR